MLYVSRLEPENNAHLVVEAFKRVRTGHKLLIVGDAPYARDYINDLKARARRDKRIVFTGFVFGRDYRALQQNAYCYVHATEVGGTHPALLEAMGFGNCVLTLAAPENIEAIGDAGIAYADEADLAEKLQRVLRDGSLVHAYRNRAQARVKEAYDWDYVVDQYEDLFAKMAGLTLACSKGFKRNQSCFRNQRNCSLRICLIFSYLIALILAGLVKSASATGLLYSTVS